MYIWDDKYLLGNKIVDTQHHRYFDILNNLLSIDNHKLTIGEITLIISFLQEYADHHLKDEEALMQTHHYPEYDKHRKYHLEFYAQTEELYQQSRNTQDLTLMVPKIKQVMIHWLTNHIITVDQAISTYINTGKCVAI